MILAQGPWAEVQTAINRNLPDFGWPTNTLSWTQRRRGEGLSTMLTAYKCGPLCVSLPVSLFLCINNVSYFCSITLAGEDDQAAAAPASAPASPAPEHRRCWPLTRQQPPRKGRQQRADPTDENMSWEWSPSISLAFAGGRQPAHARGWGGVDLCRPIVRWPRNWGHHGVVQQVRCTRADALGMVTIDLSVCRGSSPTRGRTRLRWGGSVSSNILDGPPSAETMAL